MTWNPISKLTSPWVERMKVTPTKEKVASRGILIGGAPRDRRFLLMTSRGTNAVDWVWVDDEGSCNEMDAWKHDKHESCSDPDSEAHAIQVKTGHGSSPWHLYQVRPTYHGKPVTEVYNNLAVRCPKSLSPEELKRVVADNPLGTLRATLQSAKKDLNTAIDKRRGFKATSDMQDIEQ